MAKVWLAALLALYFVCISTSFILPLKKTDGSLDTEHLLGHLTLLEQTVSTFQQTVTLQNADITALKTELSNLKSNQQINSNQNADIAALKTEISGLKANQQKLDTKIFDLQKIHFQLGSTTGVASMQNVVNAVSTEIRSVSQEVTSLTAKVNNITQDYHSLSSSVFSTDAAREAELKTLEQRYQTLSLKVNSTDAARKAELKTLEQRYKTLSSNVNSTDAARKAELKSLFVDANATTTTMHKTFKTLKYDLQSLSSSVNSTHVKTEEELKALQQKYQTFSSQINSISVNQANQNLSGTVRNLQTSLAGVLGQVHAATNDRMMLNYSLTTLNKRIADLATRSNTTTSQLSTLTAKIGELNTDVGFESWMRSSTTSVSVSATLKFSDIKYNIGGGYDASRGKFTAPVAGTYLFWTQVRTQSHSNFYLYLRKRENALGSCYYTSGDSTGTVIAATYLTAGEDVYVEVSGSNLVIYNAYTSKFGATLLYKH